MAFIFYATYDLANGSLYFAINGAFSGHLCRHSPIRVCDMGPDFVLVSLHDSRIACTSMALNTDLVDDTGGPNIDSSSLSFSLGFNIANFNLPLSVVMVLV